MIGRRRRQEAVKDLVGRAHRLPPEQVGLIMSVSLLNALVSVALGIVLLVLGAPTARRAYRVRGRGVRVSARTALPRPLVLLACVYGAHRFCSRMLLLAWVRRAVERAEDDAQPHDDQRPTS